MRNLFNKDETYSIEGRILSKNVSKMVEESIRLFEPTSLMEAEHIILTAVIEKFAELRLLRMMEAHKMEEG